MSGFPESEPTAEPEPEIVGERRRTWVWPSVAVGVLLFVLFAAWVGVDFKHRTSDGVIVLEHVPNGSEILVDGNKIDFKWPGVDKPLEIRAVPGQRKVEVKWEGLKTFGEVVTVKADRSAEVIVRLEPRVVERPSKNEADARHAKTVETPTPATVRPVISRFARNDVEGWHTLNQDGSSDATWNFRTDSLGDNSWLLAIDHRNAKE